jgi:hypothetical protein
MSNRATAEVLNLERAADSQSVQASVHRHCIVTTNQCVNTTNKVDPRPLSADFTQRHNNIDLSKDTNVYTVVPISI